MDKGHLLVIKQQHLTCSAFLNSLKDQESNKYILAGGECRCLLAGPRPGGVKARF